MSLTINAPDALRRSVESASGGKNTVIYTAKGQPCQMFVLSRYTVESIDASLGTGTHPAFIVGGVEKPEILIGQFCGASINGEMLSQPGRAVVHSINHDNAVALARANGAGWHVMTNVEWAAIMLRCWRDGWQPRGNTDYGRSSDAPSEFGTQESGRAITTGGAGSGGTRTLTGSGPAAWRHDRTPFGIADLSGNVWEWSPGMRTNNDEVQVLANNDAAATSADLSAASAAWRAIDGETGALVTPGSPNTVRYATSGTTAYTLVRANGQSFEGMTNPGVSPLSAAALQTCKRLGLFPVAPTGLGGDGFYLAMTGERLPLRGGNWGNAGIAGVSALSLGHVRTNAPPSFSARPAFVA